ncbi:hypothetical protein L1987_30256 [Smallanthus sonchifolius]|uniref:Uncharacterized protein n=1 Tax=Smallanthus sonchifolius TaxID=185202 RepID=A0ACB9I428_9ASTR|nr:hypothetical protein L1987_30256 [Smallanthus sonchifolius]
MYKAERFKLVKKVNEEEAEEDALACEDLEAGILGEKTEEEEEVEKPEEVVDGKGDNVDDGDDDGGDDEGGDDSGDVGNSEEDSLLEANLEDTPSKFEKDGSDEKIEYETVDRQKVETDVSLDQSKMIKHLPPIPDPFVQTIKPKKTEDTRKINSLMYDSVKDLFGV